MGKNIYQNLVKQHGLSLAQKIIINLVGGGEILEVGSSAGYMTKEITNKDCKVDIVEVDKVAAQKASKYARNCFIASIEDQTIHLKIKNKYDYIICADVLEHLIDPEKVLLFLKTKLKNRGQLLISIPNIAFWDMRLGLLKGRFDYQSSGLLDKTHLRFYTYDNFLQLLRKQDFKIIQVYLAEGRIPLEHTLRKIPLLRSVAEFIKPKVMNKFPNLTYLHYVVQATV